MAKMKKIAWLENVSEKIAKGEQFTRIEPEHLVIAIARTDRTFDIAIRIVCPDNYEFCRDALCFELSIEASSIRIDSKKKAHKRLKYSKCCQNVLDAARSHADKDGRKYVSCGDVIECCCKINEIANIFRNLGLDTGLLVKEMRSLDSEFRNEAEVDNGMEMPDPMPGEFGSFDDLAFDPAPVFDDSVPAGLSLMENPEVQFAGREDIISRAEQALTRCGKGNLMLIGKPGVGKNAIVGEIARRIKAEECDPLLRQYEVYELSVAHIVSGTMFRGVLEEKLIKALDYLESTETVSICFIDEIHTIINAGRSHDSGMSVGDILKPYLLRGKIKFIGATTEDEYKKYFEKDKALMRRFSDITVEEPSEEEAIRIISGSIGRFSEGYKVDYPMEAVKKAVELSSRYIAERYLPDKAFDVLDEAGNICRRNGRGTVTREDICSVISAMCRIPSEKVELSEKERLSGLCGELKKRVFGQDTAAQALAQSVLTGRAGLTARNKPEGIYLLTGPTGVGKTEIARALADLLGMPLIRYDMSEYSESQSTSKLIGAPAGYAGCDSGGRLVDDIRRNPCCVLLLDEFEKANRDIHNLFLQVFDNAELTDNMGRKADFRHVIILMTSNCGAADAEKNVLGFNNGKGGASASERRLRETFTPEFRNRLTAVIPFNGINTEMAERIAEKSLSAIGKLLEEKDIALTWDSSVICRMVSEGFDSSYGGRSLMRWADTHIKPLIVNELLFGKLSEGGAVNISCNEEGFLTSVSRQSRRRKNTVGA